MTALSMSEANKLKNIQNYLEKNNFGNNLLKYDWNLFNYITSLEKERIHELNDTIYRELQEIWQLLNNSRKLLLKRSIDMMDLNLFKKEMVSLQDKIQAMKSKLLSNHELLKGKERILSELNDLYSQKLMDWEKPVKLMTNHYRKISSGLNGHNKEVQEFMDFVIKSNGHENGWSNEDHVLFLKLRNKYKNLEDLATNLHKLLPDLSTSEVTNHELWFRQYLHLKKKKNEAVKRWQKMKSENSQQPIVSSSDNSSSGAKVPSKIKITDEHTRERIAFWKEEKEAKRREEEKMNAMRKDELRRLEEYNKMINIRNKEAVKKWKEEKIIKKQSEQIQKELIEYQEKKIREAEANKMIKQFQSRDDIFIARMRYKNRKETNRTPKRSRSSYLAERDPKRVLKPTKQWTIKISKIDDYDGNAHVNVPNIRAIPKLRIPEWRKAALSTESVF